MSYYYFDSSALVKRYIRETGTNWVRSIALTSVGHIIITARITRVEIMSAVSRLRREGVVAARTATAIQLILNRHMRRDFMVLELTDAIVQRAVVLFNSHALRAYDSVQLASALESNRRLTARGLTPITFVSADQRLLTAAVNKGLATEDPKLYS